MNTTEITYLLKQDLCLKAKFLGVFARDELPLKIEYPSCLILNTHNRAQPGEHWLAIYFNKDRTAEFFDSMALHASFYNLEKYLDTTSRGWMCNKHRIQADSNFCGLYCCFFLFYKCRGYEMFKIENMFEKENFQKNDLFISKFIKTYKI